MFSNRAEAEKAWNQAWTALPQSLINEWMEGMPELPQKGIDHEGDNDFHS